MTLLSKIFGRDTALHRSVDELDCDMVARLVAGRVKIDARDRQGLTPLHRATLVATVVNPEWPGAGVRDKQALRIVRSLLDAGADPNSQLLNGRAALHVAAMSENRDHEGLAKLLLEHSSDPNLRDKCGRTALHYAAASGNEKVAAQLLASGADHSLRDREGDVPLHCAASHNRPSVVTLLLDKGADPNKRGQFGQTALHRAALMSAIEVASILLASGCNVDAQADDGGTALHVAVAMQSAAMVGLLLAHNATAGAASLGVSPEAMALAAHRSDIAEMLARHRQASKRIESKRAGGARRRIGHLPNT